MGIEIVATSIASLFGNISIAFAMALFSFILSAFVAVTLGLYLRNGILSLSAFFITLFIFGIFGWFPLWIVALPIVILILIFSSGGRDEA